MLFKNRNRLLFMAGSLGATATFITFLAQGLTLTHAVGLLNPAKFENLSLGTLMSGIAHNVGNSTTVISDNETQNDMLGMSNMMKAPLDVTIKVESNPVIPVGTESQIKLLVLDKTTQKPMTGAQVIIGVERGAAMTTMDMMGPMFQAQEQGKGAGIYVFSFTPDIKGIYTLHTHVILPGKPMYSMMNNHLDIGIVAR